MSELTKEQREWMAANPEYRPIGPPRMVKFLEWGNLYPDGTYEVMSGHSMRVIDLSRKPIGVAIYATPTPEPRE